MSAAPHNMFYPSFLLNDCLQVIFYLQEEIVEVRYTKSVHKNSILSNVRKDTCFLYFYYKSVSCYFQK